jgi:hypothetical protein
MTLRFEMQNRADAQQEFLGIIQRAQARSALPQESAGAVSRPIVLAANRSRRPPGESFTSGSS